MSRLSHTLALAGSLCALALIGCNAVLGIDEAHSRDDGGSSTSTAQVIPVAGCETPGTEFSAHFSDSQAYADCLASHDCRKALDAYRACLGSKCNGIACFDKLSAGAGQQIADVVHAESPQFEGIKPIASVCDLYCACMGQTLPPATKGAVADGLTCETFAGVSWEPGNKAQCKDACEALAKVDLASVNCRWGHCELAANGEARGHCGHAIDDSICPALAVPNAACTDRSLKGWACEGPRDCCSNNCSGNICK
jgi:hypothetical protein